MTSNQSAMATRAEIEFLRWLEVSLVVFFQQAPNFRLRKIAADFGAKHLARLHSLEEKERGESAELPLEEGAAR